MMPDTVSTTTGTSPSPLRMYLGMMAATVALSAIMALPELLIGRESVRDVLLHGRTVPVMLLCMTMVSIIYGGLTVLRRSRTLSRHAGATLAVMMLLALEMPLVFFGHSAWRDHRVAEDLMARGIPVRAQLVRMFDTECTKAHRCTIEAEYRFTPVGAHRSVEGFARLGNTPHDPGPAYNYARQNGVVPIRYDPRDPSHSLVDWGQVIARQASLAHTLGFFGLVGGLIFAVWFVFVAIAGLAVRRKAGDIARAAA
ncbi:DUF3592 domain-containing protein [Sphingomonas sp. FARSPH]|uniref:DUF3592 domain-containing protein n=1 Tax=Sphingomonas sp. FARSPH TaxID=2219696 RepID=UPI000E102819|nr:DUF3592 domain-containing protein [Sphingomonas sp. FARSPH]AXJ96319.1 hypothetical protein DM480_13255 [Sphingomonas sp. FARSPH]